MAMKHLNRMLTTGLERELGQGLLTPSLTRNSDDDGDGDGGDGDDDDDG